MAAPLGFFTVVDNVDVIAADHMNSAIQQGSPFFASAAARDSVWPTPHEGAISYVTGTGWQRREAGAWKTWLPVGSTGRQEHLWLPMPVSSAGNFPADSTERAIPSSQINVTIPPWASTLQVTAFVVDLEAQTPGVAAFNYNSRLRLAGSVLYGTTVRSRGQSAHCYATWPVTAYRGTAQQLVWMINALSGSSQVNVAAGSTAFTYQCLFT